jgi:ubiquinone/menaquinone biosynthesis C-methylase UbiE
MNRAQIGTEGIRKLDFSGERIIPGEVPRDLEVMHRRRYEFAARYVEGKRVLDVGCGEGYGSAILAETAAHVTGIDVSEEAIAHAAAKYVLKNVEFVWMSAEKLSFPANGFDVAVCLELIEHTRDGIAVMEEMRRVVRPEGTVILSTPNKRVVSPGSRTPLNKFHVREFTVRETKELCRRYFSEVEFFSQTNPFEKSRRWMRWGMGLDFARLRKLFPRGARERMKWGMRGALGETIEEEGEADRWSVVKGVNRDSHPIIAVCRKGK